MHSLEIEKIGELILPKDTGSYLGISCSSCNSNISYSYLYDREISNIKIDVNKSSSIKFINTNTDKSLDFKLDMNSKSDKIQTTLLYNPYLQGKLKLVNQIQNLITLKNYSVPFIKIEADNNNDFNIFFKQKIRPFADGNNAKMLKINVENSYFKASSLFCSTIHFIFPSAKFSLFTNTKQSIFSMNFNETLGLSFVFYDNHFVTSLPEIYIEDMLKRTFSSFTNKRKKIDKTPFLKDKFKRIFSFFTKKNEKIDKVYIAKDKFGFKYDTGNNFFLLRHESFVNSTKIGDFDFGLSFVYRANSMRTASAIKFTPKSNDKFSISVGKTEDMKLSTDISVPFKDIALFTSGFYIGPFTHYPSKSFYLNVKFFD